MKRITTAAKLPSGRREADGDQFSIEEVSFERERRPDRKGSGGDTMEGTSITSTESEGSYNEYQLATTRTFSGSVASEGDPPFLAQTATVSESMVFTTDETVSESVSTLQT